MKNLPLADPGSPPPGSPTRYLLWITRVQPLTVTAAVVAGIVWMVAQALMPAVVGRAIDAGVAAKDNGQLQLWAFALLGVGLTQAVAGIVRHRFSVTMWLDASFRSVQLIGRASSRVGAALPKRVATGEVVSVGANDMAQIGNCVEALGRAVGSLVAFVVVAVILLTTSVTLGLTVLIGMPVLLLAIGPLLRPLQHRNMAAREMQGQLNSLASDIVVGLRVLRGIGGEDVFHGRYVAESQRVREAGVKVARLQSLLDALQVLLPGTFVVVVVWLGARMAVQGQISPGELVAFYGYAAFLVIPLRSVTEFANKLIRGRVAASRLLAILSLQPEFVEPTQPAGEPAGSRLVDEESGFIATPGRLTALVSEDQAAAARVADRLGKFLPGPVTLDGVPLAELATPVVRRRVLVSDTTSTLFSGVLRDELDVRGRDDDLQLHAALTTASAEDVMDALPDGLDTQVEEKGRSFSGGQRQRLVLARALVADPDVLVLVEPTSAVDAHTEARIAARLNEARTGRTTVVTTSSPLLLDHVDDVAFMLDGRVVATGDHRHLLDTVPAYRRTVIRGEDD